MHCKIVRGFRAVVAAAAVAGCSGEGSGGSTTSWRAAVDSLGDTVTVRTVSGSVWGDTAYLEPEVSIGMMEGPDEYLLGSPRAVAVGRDGTIFVLDRQVLVVRAYGPDGIHVRDIGREGGGPGEYRNPDGMTTLPDGRVLVRDPGNARIAVFDSAGNYLEQWSLPGGFNTSRRFYVDTAGNSYAMVLLQRDVAVTEWTYGLARYSPQGVLLDTVPAPTWDFEAARVVASQEGNMSVSGVPFSPQAAWTFSPLGYTVGGLSTDYRIDLFRPGEPVLRIEREWTPVPVNPAESEERVRRQTLQFQRDFGSWRWNGPPIPDTKPPFRNIIVSEDGNLWVQTSQEGRATMTEADAREEEARTRIPPLRFEEPPAFDVFAPDGSFLGPVRVPESFSVFPEPIVRGDTVWAVTRDELDVATIVRFRLVHPDTR
jgi:hypothetical protein